jgi:hypothetical protein
MAETDEWMRLLDEGRRLDWTGEQVPTAGTATVPRQILTAMRLGRWYWVGVCTRVGEATTESRRFELDQRDAVRTQLMRGQGALRFEAGDPRPLRLTDPLLGTTHQYEFVSGDGYQVNTLQVWRQKDGSYARADSLQIFDGMGFGDTRVTPLDLAGAQAAIDEGFASHAMPAITERR